MDELKRRAQQYNDGLISDQELLTFFFLEISNQYDSTDEEKRREFVLALTTLFGA